MSTVRLHPVARYGEFAAAWDRLNEASAGLPVLSSLFIGHLLRVFGGGCERLVVFGEPGEERAMCILSGTRPGVWQTWQPAQAPLGAWVMRRGLSYADLLADLVRRLPGVPLLVAVTQQDPTVHERPAHTARLKTLDYIETSWIEVQGSFDAYWKARGSQLRQNMRTQRTRLARDGTTASLEEITRAELVAGAIDDFGRLESAGWKGAEGTAVHPGNDQGRFYRTMLEDFCRIGAGRIYRYRLGDRVVAVDLCIESRDVQVGLKTTYDESLKGLSPSSLLRQEAYRRIFDEGRIRRIEFYGRRAEWHKRWTDCARTLYHVNFYRSAVVAAAASGLAALRAAGGREARPPQ
jgi:CelD/BcsL family acetyltransferase involved in cellulose biosynthesis